MKNHWASLEWWAVLTLGGVALVCGWWVFWFLCDDAFIAFRYISNSQLGHGYVWNAPPYAPVEGYSSFLWVWLLDWVWTLTWVEPPESANWLGLGFGFVQLGAIVWMVHGMPLTRLAPHRTLVLGMVLLGTLTNRSVLAWTSSGLETSMFTAFVLVWVLCGLRQWWTAFMVVSAVLELSRPDGLLFCAAAVPIVLMHRQVRCLWPLAIPAAHLVWRHGTYGQWLPNTYFAKVGDPWPEMGANYLFSFGLEYGFWLLLPLIPMLVWLAFSERPNPLDPGWLSTAGVVGCLVLHVGYYTVKVGGDHFEYRVLVWTIPLIWLGAIWTLDRISLRPGAAMGYLCAVWLVGLPLPWALWLHTHHIKVKHQEGMPAVPVAQFLPELLHPLAEPFDETQKTMIRHFVGMRFQTHKIYYGFQVNRFPTRAEGLKIGPEGLPVYKGTAVGVPAWVLPHVAIIDTYGLNDAVVARNPVPRRPNHRLMAHERQPPPGYTNCFKPNIRFDKKGTLRTPNPKRRLTVEEVVACEARGWKQLETLSESVAEAP